MKITAIKPALDALYEWYQARGSIERVCDHLGDHHRVLRDVLTLNGYMDTRGRPLPEFDYLDLQGAVLLYVAMRSSIEREVFTRRPVGIKEPQPR